MAHLMDHARSENLQGWAADRLMTEYFKRFHKDTIDVRVLQEVHQHITADMDPQVAAAMWAEVIGASGARPRLIEPAENDLSQRIRDIMGTS